MKFQVKSGVNADNLTKPPAHFMFHFYIILLITLREL